MQILGPELGIEMTPPATEVAPANNPVEEKPNETGSNNAANQNNTGNGEIK